MILKILTTLVIVTCFNIKICAGDLSNVQKIYDGLNDTEKLYFSKYFLTKGILQYESGKPSLFLPMRRMLFPTDIVEDLENLDIPQSFPLQFVQKVMFTYHINKQDVFRLARGEEICIPGRGCVDPGDAGNICCT